MRERKEKERRKGHTQKGVVSNKRTSRRGRRGGGYRYRDDCDGGNYGDDDDYFGDDDDDNGYRYDDDDDGCYNYGDDDDMENNAQNYLFGNHFEAVEKAAAADSNKSRRRRFYKRQTSSQSAEMDNCQHQLQQPVTNLLLVSMGLILSGVMEEKHKHPSFQGNLDMMRPAAVASEDAPAAVTTTTTANDTRRESALWGMMTKMVTSAPFTRPSPMQRAKRIDVISRFLFPLIFAIFNLAYWINYLVQAAAEFKAKVP